MNEFAEFIARHHKAVGVFLAVVAGYGAWNSFQVGMRVQQIRELTGDAARAASESLGG